MAAAKSTSNSTRARKEDCPLLGIDLGGTKILAGVVDGAGRILAQAKKKTRSDRGPDKILDRIVDVAHDAVAAAALDIRGLGGVGIGAPGQIDFQSGTIVYAPNLGWRDFPLRDRLAEELAVRVELDNDVNAVAVAEHTWGKGRGADDLVAISVGTGIGAGIILGGRLRHGFNGTAGEIGHTVIDQDGPAWPASNRGCLEAMASRPALAKRLLKAVKRGAKTKLIIGGDGNTTDIRSGALRDAAEAGDKLVLRELRETARLLGIAVGNVINLINPEVVVLGGGLIEACGEFMINRIAKTAREHAIANAAENVKIECSELGDDAGVLGAAALVR